jgi:TonB family protein
MFIRRFVGPSLTVLLVSTLMVSPRGQAPSSPQTQTSQDRWPPPGVHVLSEPGLTHPTLMHEVKPRYTEAAMRARVQGSVTLMAVVEADGSVGRIRVVRALHPGLDVEAMAAAKQWRFTPASLGGTPVPALVTIDLSFTLRDEPRPAPMLSWPGAFPTTPVRLANEDSWVVDVAHADSLEYHVARPGPWTAMPGPDMVLLLLSADQRTVVTVAKPRPSARSMDQPLSAADLAGLGQMFSTPSPSGGSRSLAAAGQVRTPSAFWVWFEVPTTFDAATPPEPAGVPRRFEGQTDWAFVTTVGGQFVMVSCSVRRERGRSEQDFATDKRDTGSVCSRIVERLTITAE